MFNWNEIPDSEKIAYCFHVNRMLEKDLRLIYQEYAILERKYHALLDERKV